MKLSVHVIGALCLGANPYVHMQHTCVHREPRFSFFELINSSQAPELINSKNENLGSRCTQVCYTCTYVFAPKHTVPTACAESLRVIGAYMCAQGSAQVLVRTRTLQEGGGTKSEI